MGNITEGTVRVRGDIDLEKTKYLICTEEGTGKFYIYPMKKYGAAKTKYKAFFCSRLCFRVTRDDGFDVDEYDEDHKHFAPAGMGQVDGQPMLTNYHSSLVQCELVYAKRDSKFAARCVRCVPTCATVGLSVRLHALLLAQSL